MKNKKAVYLLICCVVSVWGIIGYRIYAGMGEDIPSSGKTGRTATLGYFKLLDHSKDTYVTSIDYPDPFLALNEIPSETLEPQLPKKITLNEIVAPLKPQVNWSAVLYTGYILNPQTKKKVGIFNINGREIMLSEGEESNGLKVSRFIGDSVSVNYQKASRFISLK